jgi:N-acetylglucosaminyldiphosphoundecaprenol N-acetyl-beta-D-mannosaminyltransferase
MTPGPRYPVLGVNISAVDYDAVVSAVVRAAADEVPLAVSALAVHGVMTGALDDVQRRRLNGLDVLTPDGQPVRWALRWLHGVTLNERVYGPELTVRVVAACAAGGHPVFFYGSTPATLERLLATVERRFPELVVAGAEPSRFRQLSEAEADELALRIRGSGARVVFVGLGCPRQETFAFEFRERVGVPLLAVGAAFDFLAGTLPQAPPALQQRGLEWAFRLVQEPRRLWRRYLLLNPLYLWKVLLQRSGWQRLEAVEPDGTEPPAYYG